MRTSANFQKCLTTILFLLFVILYFILRGYGNFGCDPLAFSLALPAAVLALGGIGLLPVLMTVGFFFCMVGDAMGVAGSFEGQMGAFAVAQLCFIAQFVKEIRQYVKADSRHKVYPAVLIIATLVCLIPLFFAARNILPGVKVLPIRIGCAVYALLLLSSVWTGIVRAFYIKRYMAMIGCIIFLISDFTIAWNKFTEHIPNAGIYIMTTYYTALILIFYGTILQKQ